MNKEYWIIDTKRRRKPLPLDHHRKGVTITMTMPMWEALDLWMITTGAKSRGRAVEELLRMGQENEWKHAPSMSTGWRMVKRNFCHIISNLS